MHYCQLMDGVLNNKTLTTVATPQADTLTPVSTPPTENYGDPMDLSLLELFKLGVRWAEDKGRDGGKRTFNGGDTKNDWKKGVKCWYCDKTGHLKKECRKRKYNAGKRDARVMEMGMEDNKEKDKGSGKE